MDGTLLKRILFGISAAILMYAITSELSRVKRLENIDFESVARLKMQETVVSFNRLFTETDTLCETIFADLSANHDPQALIRSLQESGESRFTDGFYIIPRGAGKITHIVNGVDGFCVETTDSAEQKWFSQAIERGDKSWGGPVFDGRDNRVLYYHVMTGDRSHLIFLYDAQKVYQKLFESGLNRFGVAYIVDRSSNFIAHPLDETRSLLELGRAFGDDVLVGMCEDIINGRSIEKEYRHTNTVTGQLCNEFLLEIDKTDWLLGLSVYDGAPLESGEYQQILRNGYIKIAVYSTLLFLLTLILIKRTISKRMSHRVILIYPVAFLIMMATVVAIYNRYPQQNDRTWDKDDLCKWDPQRIIDPSSLNGFIDTYQQESIKQYNQPAQIIPTGVYIYSVSFLDSHNIQIAGTFWQKFLITGRDYPEEMRRKYHYDSYESKGLFFPGGHVNSLEQSDSVEVMLDNRPVSLYRWNFNVEIEQQLSYALYPFGKNDISLILWSNNLDDNTILTPDLESYKQIYPTDKPGLDNHFHIKGWDIAGSYYSYSMESFLCNFGNTDIYGSNRFPEMVFNISISRKFIDILICKFVPLLVVLVLLFTILFVRVKSDGFNNIIGCSGLFFVLVLDHINLRESVLSEGIMYLEFYYFISYALLLLITITSFDASHGVRSYNSWVDTVLKKYFWAIIFGAMAVVTIAFFY